LLKISLGTSMVAQWLGLHAPNAGAPGQGTRSHMLQLRVRMPQLQRSCTLQLKKIPCAATTDPTCCN
ncbi:hypothetical protein DBR06_SOUSAS3910093, partial [Sousa chinensis]